MVFPFIMLLSNSIAQYDKVSALLLHRSWAQNPLGLFHTSFYISEYFENVFNGQILHRLRIFKRWVKYILNMMYFSLYLKMFNTTWSDRKVWVESFSYVLDTIYQNMNKTNAVVSIIVRANPESLKQQFSDFRTGIGWKCSE